MILINTICKKKTFELLLQKILRTYNKTETIFLIDNLKTLCLNFVTKAGFSLSLDDFHGLNLKQRFIKKKKNKNFIALQNYTNFNNSWNKTNFLTRNFILNNLQNVNYYNNLLLMAFSGARGTPDQIYQIIGNRGLITDVQGHIRNHFIKTSLNYGLTLLDYLVSAFGARKGVIDTALKTADSGYLTRRLVETTFNLIIKTSKCEQKPLYIDKNGDFYYLKKTSLNCDIFNSFCRKCLLFNVPLGSAIGVLAAQSISEPSTQLTMRTFHTGGITAANKKHGYYYNFGFLYTLVVMSNIFIKKLNNYKFQFLQIRSIHKQTINKKNFFFQVYKAKKNNIKLFNKIKKIKKILDYVSIN